MHIDNDSMNNQVWNLKWGTQKENLNTEAFIAYCKSRTGLNSPGTKRRVKQKQETTMHPLTCETNIYVELKRRISEQFELDSDDPALLDTLEGQCSLKEKIIYILREAKIVEVMCVGLDELINVHRERLHRLKTKADNLRAHATWAIEESGIPMPIKAPDMTISYRLGKPKVVLTIEPEQLPVEFRNEKITYSANTDAIRERLLGDIPPPSWAYLENPKPTITLRTK